MKYLLTLIISILSFTANGQSVSYSPTSFSAWGATKNTEKFDVRFKSFQYTFVNVQDKRVDKNGDAINQQNHGIFFMPIVSINGLYVSGGGGYFIKNLVNKNGTNFNFAFEAGYEKNIGSISIGIKYSHISNGYRGVVNHGIDNISITIR